MATESTAKPAKPRIYLDLPKDLVIDWTIPLEDQLKGQSGEIVSALNAVRDNDDVELFMSVNNRAVEHRVEQANEQDTWETRDRRTIFWIRKKEGKAIVISYCPFFEQPRVFGSMKGSRTFIPHFSDGFKTFMQNQFGDQTEVKLGNRKIRIEKDQYDDLYNMIFSHKEIDQKFPYGKTALDTYMTAKTPSTTRSLPGKLMGVWLPVLLLAGVFAVLFVWPVAAVLGGVLAVTAIVASALIIRAHRKAHHDAKVAQARLDGLALEVASEKGNVSGVSNSLKSVAALSIQTSAAQQVELRVKAASPRVQVDSSSIRHGEHSTIMHPPAESPAGADSAENTKSDDPTQKPT